VNKKAELLRNLHRGSSILVLPNAWDAASARIFERAGFPALAPAIQAIRAAVPEMVINAHTDIFLNAIGEEATRFERAVERLNVYARVGADCLFAPGVRDRDTIAKLVKAVAGPLNILAVSGSPTISEMQAMGVARVSVGSGPLRATLGLLDRIARELHDEGTYRAMTGGAIPYDEVNELFS